LVFECARTGETDRFEWYRVVNGYPTEDRLSPANDPTMIDPKWKCEGKSCEGTPPWYDAHADFYNQLFEWTDPLRMRRQRAEGELMCKLGMRANDWRPWRDCSGFNKRLLRQGWVECENAEWMYEGEKVEQIPQENIDTCAFQILSGDRKKALKMGTNGDLSIVQSDAWDATQRWDYYGEPYYQLVSAVGASYNDRRDRLEGAQCLGLATLEACATEWKNQAEKEKDLGKADASSAAKCALKTVPCELNDASEGKNKELKWSLNTCSGSEDQECAFNSRGMQDEVNQGFDPAAMGIQNGFVPAFYLNLEGEKPSLKALALDKMGRGSENSFTKDSGVPILHFDHQED